MNWLSIILWWSEEFVWLSARPEFIRVGYYVNIDYTEPELRETPPSPPLWEKLQRNILATNPRYTWYPRKASDFQSNLWGTIVLLSSEWQSSRSTGTVVVMAPLRTLRTCRRRSGIQTSFLKTLRCFWNIFWWLILMLSRWTPPWRQPMDCQPQLPWRLNEARDFAFSQHIQSLWNSPDYILIFSVNRYPLLLRKIRFCLSWK